MLYELRIYSIPPGRMLDIRARMLNAVPPLFRDHGIRAVGHWTVVAGPKMPCFIYLLAWRDAAERDAGWASFYGDERWWKTRAETNAGSELVETYALWLLRPNRRWTTPFEAITTVQPGAIHDFVIQDAAIGRNQEVADHLADELLPIFARAGARPLIVLDMVSGFTVPSIAYFLAWPGYEARAAGWRAYHEARELNETAITQTSPRGRPLLGKSDVYLLEPAAEA